MQYIKQQITVEFAEYSAIRVVCDNRNTAFDIAAHIKTKGIALEVVEQVTVLIKNPVGDVQALLKEIGFTFEAPYPNNQFKYSRPTDHSK